MTSDVGPRAWPDRIVMSQLESQTATSLEQVIAYGLLRGAYPNAQWSQQPELRDIFLTHARIILCIVSEWDRSNPKWTTYSNASGPN